MLCLNCARAILAQRVDSLSAALARGEVGRSGVSPSELMRGIRLRRLIGQGHETAPRAPTSHFQQHTADTCCVSC
jgi:hypothetical protein